MERMQKKMNETANPQRAAAYELTTAPGESDLAKSINNSPMMAAQRKKLQGLFGSAAHRGVAAEPFHDKVTAAQRVEATPGQNESPLAIISPSNTIQRKTPCDVSGRFTSIPSGDLAVTHSPYFGGKWVSSFVMNAEFTPEDTSITDGDCSSGIYRQWVKGKFVKNGKKLDHDLYNSKLDESTFNLDGPPGHYYGEKAWRYERASQYAHFVNKTTFSGSDCPGIPSSWNSGEMDLTFIAQLHDERTGNLKDSSTWTVKKKYGKGSGCTIL